MDKRKNNGGNSTKANGIDKRKNQYLHLLDQASTDADVIQVIEKLKERSLIGDVQAIKLFLEYYLGKPKETIDQNVNLTNFNLKDVISFKE